MRVIAVVFAATLLMSCAEGKWNSNNATYSLSFTSPFGGQAHPRTDSSLTAPSALGSAP